MTEAACKVIIRQCLCGLGYEMEGIKVMERFYGHADLITVMVTVVNVGIRSINTGCPWQYKL